MCLTLKNQQRPTRVTVAQVTAPDYARHTSCIPHGTRPLFSKAAMHDLMRASSGDHTRTFDMCTRTHRHTGTEWVGVLDRKG